MFEITKFEITRAIVLVNQNKEGKGGWDFCGELPPYDPGRTFMVEVKELGEVNFGDNYLIYREVMSELSGRHYMNANKFSGRHKFICRPFYEGACRGVVVFILEPVLPFGKDLTEITIVKDLYDVEVDEAKQQIHSKPKALEEETLPKVPEDSRAVLDEATIERPLLTWEELSREFRRTAEANPGEARQAAEEHAAIAAEFWEHESRFIFTNQQAREISGLSHAMLTRLARAEEEQEEKEEPRLAENRDGQWYFSGTGLARYMQESRGKPGRKPKTD